MENEQVVEQTPPTAEEMVEILMHLLGRVVQAGGGFFVLTEEEFKSGGDLDVEIDHQPGQPWTVTARPVGRELV